MIRGLIGAGLAVAALRGVNALLGLAVVLLLSRNLGPAGLGIYVYCVTLLAVITIPVSYGWATLLLRDTARALHDGSWGEVRGIAVRGAQLAVAMAAIVLALVLAARGLLPEFAGLAVVALVAAALLFDQLSALRTALLRGLDRPVLGQVPEMLIKPVALAAALAAFLLASHDGLTVAQALTALALASAVTFVAGAGLLNAVAPAGLRQAAATYRDRAWFGVAGVFAGSSAITVLNSYVDVLLLGALAGAEDVGLYRVALQAALVGGLVYTALNMVAAQRFASFRAAGDMAALRVTASATARIAMVCALPLPLLLVALGDWLVPALFGSGFAPALVPMLILASVQIVNAAAGMARTLLMMGGGERQVMAWSAAALAANAALCLALIPRHGAVGAALANAASLTFWNCGLWITAWRRLGIDTSIIGLKPAAA